MNLFEYMSNNSSEILSLLLEHIQLTAISVGLAILIGVPLGILIYYVKKLNKPVLAIANIIQAIPSLALLGFAIPFLGIGEIPAIVMVILYSLLPIIKNTYIGINNVNKETIEAAQGIGLTKAQILFKIQIPLALPVIMAGVRISTVTAVGLVTIAAFIGAGGLGYLVYSGIRTINNNQILAGAIPACLLALLVDFVLGIIESLVTPISLQKIDYSNVNKLKKKRKYQKSVLVAVSIILIIVFGNNLLSGLNKNDKVITIGTKDYTEQIVLGSIVQQLIESNTDISVNKKENLGGTQVCFSAIESKEIDMYMEYTGTAYGDILDYPPISDMEKVYNTVVKDYKEKYDLTVLNHIGFNNTYALATTKELADKYNIKTISDFAKVSKNFKTGTTFEFLNRTDGLPGLKEKYNFDVKESVALDGSPRYIALKNGDVDIVDAFSTDGILKKYDLVLLEDDKNFFPPYYAVPVIRTEILEQYPEIKTELDKLNKVLNNEVMLELNYKIDELQLSPDKVARDFLLESKLIK